MTLLDKYPEVERLHEPKTYPWFQRGIHIFDPNGHLIEVSESMYSVACKHFANGKNVEETVELTQHPLHVVQEWHKQYIESKGSDISPCGADCSACYCFGKMCSGCNECNGMVFHAPEGKACEIYECSIHNKKLKNCGECKEVPCAIWMKTRDPKFSDEEFDENVNIRVKTLKER
jgi:hypothetical protein